jgi:hypothetical protein
MYEKHRLEWPTAKYFTHPRRIGLISSINPVTGWERWPRNISLSIAQQCRPLLASRRPQRHPSSPTTADATELKAEKSEALSLLKIHLPALLLLHLNLELG